MRGITPQTLITLCRDIEREGRSTEWYSMVGVAMHQHVSTLTCCNFRKYEFIDVDFMCGVMHSMNMVTELRSKLRAQMEEWGRAKFSLYPRTA